MGTPAKTLSRAGGTVDSNLGVATIAAAPRGLLNATAAGCLCESWQFPLIQDYCSF